MSFIFCISHRCVDVDFTSILDLGYQEYIFNSKTLSGFLNLAPLTFGASSFFDEESCPVHCRMFHRISGPH